jgi:hypothetical protein
VRAEGHLVFVLGAGINFSYGLPLWPELIKMLLLESGRIPRLRSGHGSLSAEEELTEDEERAIDFALQALTPDPLLQAALVREAYPSNRAWMEGISRCIERRRTSPPETEDLPLRLIARMLVSAVLADRHRHISVLTFNYDDFLERAIAAELGNQDPAILQSISTGYDFERSWNSSGIYVYHLHGFLKDRDPQPVLDARSYVAVLQGDHWSWRCMERVLNQREATALFIGLSLTDPSLRFVLTRWETWKTPVLGVILAAPLPEPDAATLAMRRELAFLARTILHLYDAAMDRLQLVSYHLSTWDELIPILTEIGKDPQ